MERILYHNLNAEIELQSASEHGSTEKKTATTITTTATEKNAAEKSVWDASKRAISFAFYYICAHVLNALLTHSIQFSSALA